MPTNPKPIATALHAVGPPLLLFCPDLRGWHVGRWFDGRWAASNTATTVLVPTHWMNLPPSPTALAMHTLSARALGGLVKALFRRIFGDPKLQAEGKMDQVTNTVGSMKDSMRNESRRNERPEV